MRRRNSWISELTLGEFKLHVLWRSYSARKYISFVAVVVPTNSFSMGATFSGAYGVNVKTRTGIFSTKRVKDLYGFAVLFFCRKEWPFKAAVITKLPLQHSLAMAAPTFIATSNHTGYHTQSTILSPLFNSGTGNIKQPAIRVLSGRLRLTSYRSFPILLDASDPLVQESETVDNHIVTLVSPQAPQQDTTPVRRTIVAFVRKFMDRLFWRLKVIRGLQPAPDNLAYWKSIVSRSFVFTSVSPSFLHIA